MMSSLELVLGDGWACRFSVLTFTEPRTLSASLLCWGIWSKWPSLKWLPRAGEFAPPQRMGLNSKAAQIVWKSTSLPSGCCWAAGQFCSPFHELERLPSLGKNALWFLWRSVVLRAVRCLPLCGIWGRERDVSERCQKKEQRPKERAVGDIWSVSAGQDAEHWHWSAGVVRIACEWPMQQQGAENTVFPGNSLQNPCSVNILL